MPEEANRARATAEEERFDAELAKQLAARERAQAQNAKTAFMEKKALEFGRKWAQVGIHHDNTH